MPVINIAYEHYIDTEIRSVFAQFQYTDKSKKQHRPQYLLDTCHLAVGRITRHKPAEQSVQDIVSHDSLHTSEGSAYRASTAKTIHAFQRLPTGTWVAYSMDYHIGFPIGLGAVKYIGACLSPEANTSHGMLDLPDGADQKLSAVLAGKDPFRWNADQWLVRLKAWLGHDRKERDHR